MVSSDDLTVQHIVTAPGPEIIKTGSEGRDRALGCRDRVYPGESKDHVAGNHRLEGENDGAHTEITSNSAFVVPAEGAAILKEAFFEVDA
jgi:hypothetical protein